ncbi:MAG: hypothetical protein WCY04_05300 [Bacilli bacterium]|jgi:hypothetical protein
MDFNWDNARSLVNRVKALVIFIHYDRKEKIFKGKIKGFTGYKTVARIPVEENQKFLINIDIYEGEAQFVLVQKGLVYPLKYISATGHVLAPNRKGYVRLRLIGEKASLSFTLKKIDEASI